MIPALRDYQLDLVERLAQRAREGKRVIIAQAPTGAGKTSMMAHLARRAVDKEKRVLIIAHRRRLVDQISDRLFQFQVDHGVMMRGHRLERDARVQVASRDTLVSRCIDNQWVGLPPADLVMPDEGRHAASQEYQNILGHYPSAVIIPFDATPVLSDGSGLGPWAEAIECAAPVSQLIRDGYLVPVKCYAPERMGQAKRQGKIVRGIAGDLIDSWQRYSENMPTVVFASRVEHSRNAVKMFVQAGIPAAHLDADTPDDERDRIFDAVGSGKIKVVCNVGIMSEGVDVPSLGCCVFWCNVNGRVRFLQGVGRVMRPHPGKDHAVLIDHAAAVWQHGFPDEDTEWTLTGNADANFAKAKAEGKTKTPYYCKYCELVYSDTLECPQCGRRPQKPPKSIFAAEEVEVHEEVLTECERRSKEEFREQEKVRHWLRCLGVAVNRHGSFWMAMAVWKRRFGEYPPDDFPNMVPLGDRNKLVSDVYPNYGRRKGKAS